MGDRELGTLGGLSLSVKPAALVASAIIWAVMTVIGVAVLHFSLGSALVGSLIAVALHWLGELLHGFGHAAFARQTGYPMSGLLIGTQGGFFAATLYPPNEPPLPDSVHLQRALGGPFISLQASILGGLILFALSQGERGLLWWLALFFFLENFLIFTLQAVVPVGFNDGSTIWRILRKRR